MRNDVAGLHGQAVAAVNARDWAAAEGLCAKVLALDPAHADAHFLAGIVADARGQTGGAITWLRRAAALAPDRAEYHAQLARCLSKTRHSPEAVVAAEQALALAPQEALTLDTIGVVLSAANQHVRAAEVFRRATTLSPRRPEFQFNLASSLKFLGDFDGAEGAYEACLQADPHHWKAHSALAQLRRQTAGSNHIARLESLLPAAGDDADAGLHLHMALAKEHEDLGDYASAFRYLIAGKSRKRAALGYSIEQDRALFEAIERLFPDPVDSSAGSAGHDAIFVVGMPRTGTTLVERILSSHSQLRSVGESQNFALALKRAAGTRSPRVLDLETLERARSSDLPAVGRAYLDATRPAGAGSAHFVDKMPLNFLYAGFIRRALPGARIICLRRHPLDACLSNFRQLFALGYSYYNYAYDLLDCGRYYVLFDRLMAHWQRVLPGAMLGVSYEALVGSQEPQTRRLLEFCGLAWEDGCLHFEDNVAPVSTASAVQVRSPLYASAVGRWRRYSEETAELRSLLESAGIPVPEH
jgi:Flp pilus assembly protein TadD